MPAAPEQTGNQKRLVQTKALIQRRHHKAPPADLLAQGREHGNESADDHNGQNIFENQYQRNAVVGKVLRIESPVYHVGNQQIDKREETSQQHIAQSASVKTHRREQLFQGEWLPVFPEGYAACDICRNRGHPHQGDVQPLRATEANQGFNNRRKNNYDSKKHSRSFVPNFSIHRFHLHCPPDHRRPNRSSCRYSPFPALPFHFR